MTDHIHLVVATPVLRRTGFQHLCRLHLPFAAAARTKSNLDLSVLMRDGDALITRARANLVTMFLDDPSATHLLFVDADIGFTPDQVFRLIESGADVVAGIYPIKRVNWDKARRDARRRAAGGAVGRARLRAGDRGSRPCRRRQRIYPRAPTPAPAS